MSIAENLVTIAENVPKVYDAGKKAEYNEFWDNINTLASYRFAGTAWNKNTFKPNKDITVGNFGFYYHNWQGTAYDLAAQLENAGVTLTLNSAADQQTFYYAWFTRLPKLNFTKCSGVFDRVFQGDAQLVTIDKIILPPEGNVTSFNAPFTDCTKLKNITFEGVIDKSITFSPCPLSATSIKSVISCLKNFSGTSSEYTYTVTFKSSAFNTLESEGATAEHNGVPCTWAELIDNKKWNLVKA